MDLYGTLQLKWSAGYDGSQIHFVSNTTLLHANGNALRFIDTSGRHVKSLPSQGRGVGPIATAPQAGIIVYAESTLHPRLFVLSYPSCQLEATLEGSGAELEYVSLAMTSSSGKMLASLSGVPDFILTLWDLQEGCELCRTSVGPGGHQLSLNPMNWKQMCVLGQNQLTLYLVEQCDDDQLIITPQETTLPDVSLEVMSSVQPPSLPLSVIQVQSKPSEPQSHQTRVERLKLPDLSRVLYRDTYDEYTAERKPVQLSSHCWSSQQALFVGCKGGQLLNVDFDTGVIKVLANPHLSQLESVENNDGDRKEEDVEDLPNTAHAVLTEGSLECLVLGRRGLFAAGKGGKIYCFAVSAELQVVETHTLSEGDLICFISWSPDYTRLAIETQQAAIHIVNPLSLSKCTLLSSKSYPPIIGLDVLSPGAEHIVTCRADGTVEVWDLNGGSLVSSLSLKCEACCVVCPISSSLAIVGSVSGHLSAVDLTKTDSPRVVMRKRLYRSPLTHLKCDQRGRFLVTAASSETSLFVCSGSPSNTIEVLGHTGVRGEMMDLSVSTSEPGTEEKTKIAALSKINDQTLLTLFNLPNSTEITTPGLHEGGTRSFSREHICKIEVPLSVPASSIELCSLATLYAVIDTGCGLAKFSLPLEEKDMDSELSPDIVIATHDAGTVKLELSYHQKWISSAGSDGRLLIRLVEKPEKSITCKPHHYRTGGCSGTVFSRDGQHIVTVGDKGAIHCWRWEFTNHGSVKGQAAADYLRRVIQSLGDKSIHRHNRALETLDTLTDLPPAEEESTWLQAAEENAHRAEDEQYADQKSQLRQGIGNLRGRLLEMIESNERAPDLEKLGRQEFILDMEQHDRLQTEEDQQIQQVREEINLSSLAKMFLREQIKTECWQSMDIKGKIIKGFNGTLEVGNYPVIHRSEEELKELDRIRTLRTIEQAEREVRNEVLDIMKKAALVEETNDEGEDGEEEVKGTGEEEDVDSHTLYGSHGPKYGGGCEYLYHQFELNSPVAKKNQIILLKNCMHMIAETFNKEFDDVVRLKHAEIARIREKNIRISKIVQQLQLEEKLVQPTLEPEEKPEELLTVRDEEVKVEKYLSPEERLKQEEAAKQEEERRLAEMGDNPRERALDMMMGGRLEANVEEDLFKDLPRPDFMDKDPTERTEEEIRAALEFEKKETEFLEEREKLRKALEGELRKLQSTISHSMESFNERLHKLFDLKINTEMTLHQEQLKVVGLMSSLQVEEEVAQREEQLNALLQDKKSLKTHLAGLTKAAQVKMEEFREVYDQILVDDKTLDRNFKRDFSDCEPFVDQLYKLFKRKPRGQRLRQGISEAGLVTDSTVQNPFSHRPPTATRDGQKLVVKGSLEDAMIELDHPSNMPEGVDTSQWDRLVAARRRKRDSEAKVKAAALKLAEMESFLKRRQVEEERLQTEIQDSFSELNRLSEEKMLFNQDLAVQLLLRQGQVEVEEGDFVPDYSDSVLVHREVIEELNKEIKTHGEGKLASMNECKDFRRGIRQQEWECSRLKMQVEDLQEEVRDVQLLRVTKELQRSLCEGNSRGHDQHELEMLEKTLELTERVHKDKVREKKKQLAKLQAQGQKRRVENRQLDDTLVEKQVSVLERQEAERLAGIAPSVAGAKQRMADIVSRRRMVELVRAQAAEIQVMRAELERLRMATFPALVQVE